MQEFLDFFGHGFCHQIRERSLEAGGLYFSACARDTGLYLGLAVTVLIICLLYRRRGVGRLRPSGLPPLPVVLIAIILVLPMAVDGVSSYLYLRQTSNLLRFFTGYGAGMGVGLVAAAAVLEMFGNSSDNERVLARPRQAATAIGLSALMALAFWLSYPYLGIVSPLVAVLAFLAIMVTLNAVILSLSHRFEPSGTASGAEALSHLSRSARVRWATILALASCLALAEIAVLGLARDLIFGFLFAGAYDSFQEFFEALIR
jgi:uncharacterized membrane protein